VFYPLAVMLFFTRLASSSLLPSKSGLARGWADSLDTGARRGEESVQGARISRDYFQTNRWNLDMFNASNYVIAKKIPSLHDPV